MPKRPPNLARLQPATPDRRPSAARRGYGRDWQKVRDAFIRANPLCVECLEAAKEVDHIAPLSGGGERLAWSNLRSLCGTCHKRITANFRLTGRNAMPVKNGGQR